MGVARTPLKMAAEEEEQDLFNFPPRPHTALGSLHSSRYQTVSLPSRLMHLSLSFLSSIRITENELLFGHNPRPLESRSQPVSSPDNQFLSQQKLVINDALNVDNDEIKCVLYYQEYYRYTMLLLHCSTCGTIVVLIL